MCRILFYRTLWLSLMFGVVAQAGPITNQSTARDITIINQSMTNVEIYWVDPDTRERILISNPSVTSGASFELDSYVGHEFEAREVPSLLTGECRSEDKVCRTGIFEVSENNGQLIKILPGIKVEFMDDRKHATEQAVDLVSECQEILKERIEAAKDNTELASIVMDELLACVESGVADNLVKANEETAFQTNILKQLATKMENYTCLDQSLNSSEPIDMAVWYGAGDGKPRKVNIMFDRPSSKIHLLENFISAEECQALEDAAAPKLHRATVADGKGGSQFSQNRKAMQAGVKVNWNLESKGDPIARLSRRVYDYTEHVLGLGIQEYGQEDLMSIQYFGRGQNDTEPDRYTPHCDGDCNGIEHRHGTRMATMVMYCETPEIGGHTNFRNAGVHVKPEVGNAVFFSYINPENLIMDKGFTEHSACPVYSGQKKIGAQWIRLGVDNANPWDSFNTLGVKRSEVYA